MPESRKRTLFFYWFRVFSAKCPDAAPDAPEETEQRTRVLARGEAREYFLRRDQCVRASTPDSGLPENLRSLSFGAVFAVGRAGKAGNRGGQLQGSAV